MKRIISTMLVCIMLAMPFTFATAALACEDDTLLRIENIQTRSASASTLQNMKTYLQTRYNNTSSSNSNIGSNMGYLIALKAIEYAINETPYSSYDCSKMTYTAIKDAYLEKGYSTTYHLFGSSRKSSREQYSICSSNGLTGEITKESEASALQTGDLLFWRNPSTHVVNHVGIYFNYGGQHCIIETTSTNTKAYVSEGIWGGLKLEDGEWVHSNANYELFAYAHLTKTVRATYKTGEPFNESLGFNLALYNCPPTPPTLPTHSGYAFASWTPSITAGITSNTTYTANYILRANRSLQDK